MNIRHSLFTTAAAATLIGVTDAKQIAVDDYNFNWHNMSNGSDIFVSGPDLFGFISGGSGYAGPGDSIRTCYGIDSFQGGRNQSDGHSNITHVSLTQGHGGATPTASFGLISIHAQSTDSLDGDACLSSLFAQGTDPISGLPITLNHALGFQAVLGSIPGTGSSVYQPWTIVIELTTSSTGLGATLPTTLGTSASGFPLLPHVIFEVQGPLNAGPSNNQYFLASTTENLGPGTSGSGTGGVTNGNGRFGFSVWGSTADVSGALSHNRLTAQSGGSLVATTSVFFTGPEHDFWNGYVLASQTPSLWASNNGDTGGGGPDWTISTNPISSVNLRMMDVRSGAQGDSLYASSQGIAALGALLDNPGLAFNAACFLWSATPAALMLQTPMSWDTASGTASAGNQMLGPQTTCRVGDQTVPINLDGFTLAFLQCASLSIGTTFSSAVDSNSDNDPTTLFELGEGFDTGGSSTLPAAFQLAANPHPGLQGVKLGVAAVGVQFDSIVPSLHLTEFASSVEAVLQ